MYPCGWHLALNSIDFVGGEKIHIDTGCCVKKNVSFLLLALALCFSSKMTSLGLPAPSGIYNQVLAASSAKKRNDFFYSQKADAQGVDKSLLETVGILNSEINSPCGKLVAVKFTLQKELDSGSQIKEISLASDLKDKARLFCADYRVFLDFLHSQVYGKIKLSKLDIPSVLFFRSGELVLPIEPWEFSKSNTSQERLEALIRGRLEEKDDADDNDPHLLYL